MDEVTSRDMEPKGKIALNDVRVIQPTPVHIFEKPNVFQVIRNIIWLMISRINEIYL